MCMKAEVIKNPLIKDVVSQWEFVWVFKSMMYLSLEIEMMLYTEVCSECYIIGRNKFPSRKI